MDPASDENRDYYGMNAKEWDQVKTWNSSSPNCISACVHDLVFETAKSQPDAIAVCSWDGRWTYSEFVSVVDRVSSWLFQNGVSSGDMVLLMFEKSKWAIVAIFSIMRVGAAWVPLDLKQPFERTLEIIRQTSSRHVATSKALANAFSENSHLSSITIDQDLLDRLCSMTTIPTSPVEPHQVAFVMFTSGTTGKPNGVVIEHRAMVTAALSYAPELGLGRNSRVIQFTAWIWLPCSVEIITTLIRGGRICIPSEDDRVNNAPDFIRKHKVNLAVLAPSFLRTMSPHEVPSLKSLGVGGEKIPQAIIDQWSPSVKLISCFGSTETNLCILETIKQNQIRGGYHVGARAWIVDPNEINRLLPVGAVGELVIESWALARGYLNDEGLTLKKFPATADWIQDPGLGQVGKLCRVGDLARYNIDGTICIVGRGDNMAKVRGQRLDMGEVEAQLRQALPCKMQAVVEFTNLRGDEAPKIIAFVDPNQATSNERTGLGLLAEPGPALEVFRSCLPHIKAELSKSLPMYMIPSAFVPVLYMPLISTGKLDRQKLREMAANLAITDISSLTSSDIHQRPPRSQIEVQLCDLWGKLLNVAKEKIGLDDHFISLGGDSVTAIRLVCAARAKGLELTVDAIFQKSRLWEMALACRKVDQIERAELNWSTLQKSSEEGRSLRLDISNQYDISESAIQDIYPATTLQAGLIALSMKQPGAYAVRSELHLPEQVDILAFRRAWEHVVQHSPILRTRLVHATSEVMQVVLSETITWLIEYDLHDYIARDKQKMMGLGDNLTRFAIISDPSYGRRFVWTAHHALFDAWSMIQTFRLVEATYKGKGLAPAVEYKTFIEYLSTIDRELQNKYWYSQLEGASPLRYPVLPSSLYQPLTNTALKQTIYFTRRLGSAVTSATIIRTAWALLLSQYVNTDDVIFGTTISGRGAPVKQIDEIMGPTIATVPIRIRWNRDQSIASLLQNVQSQGTSMIPFEQIGMQYVKRLSSEIQHACDFQTLLVIQTVKSDTALKFLGGTVHVEDWQDLSAYALVMEAMLTDEGAFCHATYDSQVICEEEVQSLIFQFECVIQQLCLANLEMTVKDINACSRRDELQIRRFNEKMHETADLCAHDEFFRVASAQPDAPAIDAWDGRLTYLELDNEATKLAYHITTISCIAVEDVVPVIFPKSKFAVISMLAIWKLGAAFAPVDAGNPPTWIQKIVQNTRTKLVLCSSSIAESLQSCIDCLIVDTDLMEQIPFSNEPIHSSVLPKNLAYVVHTSGSTGKPKGIMHTHSTYVSGVKNRIPTMFRTKHSRVLQFASYSFDISIEDIWTTLLTGGVVCIPSDYERLNDLVGYMNRAKTTYAEITPSLARTLQPDALPYLKIVALSGESSTKADKDRWLNNVILLDEYGPAEIAIKSNFKRVEFDSHPSDKGLNVACLGWITEVSNPDKLQAKGAIGELLLEGPIVARGYLHEPEKTAEVFIENPTWLPAETYGLRRLYKTGDLATYTPNFNLRIFGRKDTQVKLRGQRLELGQIEHQVRLSLALPVFVVADLVFLKHGSKTGTLVVFVSVDDVESAGISDGFRVFVKDLQSKLAVALPSFMVPSAIIPMGALPLNMSGKIDRLKLKQVATSLNPESILYLDAIEKPSSKSLVFTEPQKRLQALWAQVLEINAARISPDDNFLHCGGDSILAMKLVAIVSRLKIGITLTVRDVFLHPRLCEMALVASAPTTAAPSIVLEPYQLLGCTDYNEIYTIRKRVATICQVELTKIRDVYPCTPLQEGLMAISLKSPGHYIAQHVFELPDSIELDRLQKAWSFVIGRTSILRTRIVQLDTMLVQGVVHQDLEWYQRRNLERYIADDKISPMKLGDPLVRLAIIKEAIRSFLVVSMHHAIYDGWSLTLIFEAVTRIYKSDTDLDFPTEYKYFIRYATSLNQQNHRHYWREQLRDAAEHSSNFPRLPQADYECKAGSTLEQNLHIAIGRLRNFTIPTVLQAAWALLLTRYSDNSDIVFGTTVNGRNIALEGVDKMIGPVFTTIPVRMKLNMRSSISEFVSQVQYQALEMIEYQHYGLQNIAKINQDTKAACQFRTLIVIHTAEHNLSSPVLGQRRAQVDFSMFNPYAMMVQFIPTGSIDFSINVSFDSNIIDEVQMRRFLSQLEFIVEQLCTSESQTAIGDIDLLDTHDREEIMTWNRDLAPEGYLSLVHEIIRDQALSNPTANAVHAWDGTLSYRALDHMSSRLGEYLLELFDLQPNNIVPICLEKSYWAVVAMLGTLKAGAAFTLLDPSHPIDRLGSIISDAKARIILASEKTAGHFKMRTEQIVLVDDSTTRESPKHQRRPDATAQPSDLACIVFTSGSTGKPKGILLEHRNLCSSIMAHGPALNVNEHSRVFQFASFAFDMAVYDILTTLCFGGCVCIPSDHDKMNNFASALEKLRANWAFLTPTTAALLSKKDVPGLKTLVVGGERVTKDICEKWIGNVRLFQCSGPAETTTCIVGEMDRTSKENCLGRGCGSSSWIVDPSNHHILQPIGVVGELVLEGPTVARGYLDKADEAAGGFIVDPQWAHDKRVVIDSKPKRMHKTGDLVQYDSEGRLLFIGRKDTQIKIRGQRLELAEVEVCLRKALPDTKLSAEVIIPSDGDQSPTLAAFVAMNGVGTRRHGPLSAEQPDRYRDMFDHAMSSLVKSLPPYMVPSMIIPLEDIPLNSSGKVDRPYLRKMGSSLTSKQLGSLLLKHKRKKPCSTAMERRLQVLWAEVLGMDRADISADDQFLRLGGNSLSAMRLVAAARRETVTLTVASIFKSPILADMALKAGNYSEEEQPCRPFELLRGHRSAADIRREISKGLGIDINDITDIYPCTPLQEGLMVLSIETPGAYVAREIYKLAPDVKIDQLKEACELVIARNAILRTRIVQLESLGMMQVVLRKGIEWNLRTDSLEDHGDNIVQLGDALTKWAFIGNKKPSLVITRHHCSYDGHSLPLVQSQIEEAYRVGSMAEEEKEIATGYNNFIRYVLSGDEKEHIKYWRKYLSGVSQVKFPRRANATRSSNPSASVSHLVGIERISDSAVTLPTVIRGAWSLLLAQYTSSSEVVFGMTLSGRNVPVPGIESICGPTFTTVPIRVNFEGEDVKVVDFLKQIQDEAIEMIPHEHYGLQNIKRISPEVGQACTFENLLVIQPASEFEQGSSIFEAQLVEGSSTFRTFAFTMVCQLLPDGVVMTANFDPDAIDEIQVRRILLQFESVTKQMIQSNGALRLSEMDMITEADQEQIWQWNAVVPEAVDSCVHDIIGRQMKFRPRSSAVDSWDGTISYRELDRLSSKLADRLISLKVGADVKVPILFEKSVWTIVAILGILRAGGAFVPLDPTHPRDRLRGMISLVEADLVLLSSNSLDLSIEPARNLIVVSSKTIDAMEHTGAWKSVRLAPRSLAYVNFTSGSTGAPKASLIEHSAYCSGAAGHIPNIAINESSRVLQFASYGFDTCIEDILTTLMVGGCICIPSDTQRESDIVGFANEFKVNWAHLTPSFASSISPEDIPSLKVLCLGGEAMGEQHVKQWSQRVKLINVYGPSELCVTCSVNTAVTASKEAANIGYAVGSISWVTKPNNSEKLAPVGTIGELLIEGPLMARGYMNDEKQTAAAFIESPSWLKQGHRCVPGRENRLYKTGDLVRYESDGSFVFVGRKDAQVKLRGQRIELGEVEYHIRTCLEDPSNSVIVEMITPGGSAVSALAAFISSHKNIVSRGSVVNMTPDSDFEQLVRKLRGQLPTMLPHHMIPSIFIPIIRIPLTASKKVDHRKLQSIASSLPANVLGEFSSGRGQSRLPKTELERQVRAIWSQTLNRPAKSIGMNTAFLLLGGDSISAMQVLARCKKAGIKISLREILQSPTVESICACIMEKETSSFTKAYGEESINAKGGVETNGHATPVDIASSREAVYDSTTINNNNGTDGSAVNSKSFPLSPIQERFFELYPYGNNSYQVCQLLELQRPMAARSVDSAIRSLVRTHTMLQGRFTNHHERGWEQYISGNISKSYRFMSFERPILGNLNLAINKLKSYINVETGPCLVAFLFTTPKAQVLFFSIHHLVADLVSWRIILQDLEELLQGPKSALSPPNTDYSTWCIAQRNHAQEIKDLAKTLPFLLKPMQPEFWGPQLSRTGYKTIDLKLTKFVSNRIFESNWTASTKPIDVLLGALLHSFSHTFPERKGPTIFNSSHGRNSDEYDLSRTVGWFTSFYALQINDNGNKDAFETIREIAGVHRELEKDPTAYFVANYLAHERKEAHFEDNGVEAEIAFNYQGRYQQLERNDGLFKRIPLQDRDETEQDVRHAAVIEIVIVWGDNSEGLEARFSFHPEIRHRGRVEEWVERFGEVLGEVAADETNHRGSPRPGYPQRLWNTKIGC